MQLVRAQLKRDYKEEDLKAEGLRIFTTLDPLLQRRAEQAVERRLSKLEKSKRSDRLEVAAVVAGSETGEIQALIGGRRSGYSGFNRALEAERPIGSLIKPVVYLEALSRPRSYSVATLLYDEPVKLKRKNGKTWEPKNFDKRSHGRVPLYLALAKSYNLATVNLGLELGVERIVARLKTLGLTREVTPLPSLLLGSLAITPYEVTQLYQAFAAGGFRAPLRAVREVLDADGKPLNRYPLKIRQVAEPGPVYLLNWTLGQVVEQGTARGLKSQLPKGMKVAGKTGTSDEYRDSWFAGFSGDRVAVVWVGRDDNKSAGLSGSKGALRVWGDIIGGDSAPLDPILPGGVESILVDPGSGLLADSQCSGAKQLPFMRGSGPQREAPCMDRGWQYEEGPTSWRPRVGEARPRETRPREQPPGEPSYSKSGPPTAPEDKNPIQSFFEKFF